MENMKVLVHPAPWKWTVFDGILLFLMYLQKKNLSFICFQGFIDKMLCGFSFLRPSWKKNLKSKTTTGQFFHVLVTNKKKKWTHIFVTV